MENGNKNHTHQKTAIIIGAGPAGLTAAYELLERTDIKPIIFEKTNEIGGISKTLNYNGNRIDIGPHRFFSKSNAIVNWWLNILPLQEVSKHEDMISTVNTNLYEKNSIKNNEKTDQLMLILKRLTRIFFLRKFFDYPLSLNLTTIRNLGFILTFKIFFSYIKTRLFPIKNEKSLEDFFINRFGRELYETFFKDYTEKVWGIPCDKIPSEWGSQRIKGLSVSKAVLHAVKGLLLNNSSNNNKNTETSLIEQFFYPKLGAGSLWEEVAKKIRSKGGEINLNYRVIGLTLLNSKIQTIDAINNITGKVLTKKADYFFSTMPVKELIESFNHSVPDSVNKVAQGITYRDLIVVNLILKKLKLRNRTKIKTTNNTIPDNWIYIQERDVKVGRLTIYNNFSTSMVKDKNSVSIGLEYFCNENDDMWSKQDKEIIACAIKEISKIEIIENSDVLESHVIRVPKAYPAYFGTYNQFDVIKNFTDRIQNLFLIGRNGMHRYNNQDHSMITAMTAVDNIINNITTKENIWLINTEKDYHEQN